MEWFTRTTILTLLYYQDILTEILQKDNMTTLSSAPFSPEYAKENAIDSKRISLFSSKEGNKNPWLQIQLGKTYNISEIGLLKRSDSSCCDDRYFTTETDRVLNI